MADESDVVAHKSKSREEAVFYILTTFEVVTPEEWRCLVCRGHVRSMKEAVEDHLMVLGWGNQVIP